MANTYYDSQLTAAEIEAALEAIDGVIVPANNGKVLAINNGKLEARSVQWGGGEAVLEPLSVTENGDYYPEAGVDGFDEVHVAVPSSSPTIQSLSVTQNGTYTAPSGVDGYSPVVVNVSGGGGGASTDYVKGEALIPAMTSNTTPSGTASCSSSLGGNFDAFRAFNGIEAESTMQQGWLAAASDNAPFIQYVWDEAHNFGSLSIHTANNGRTVSRTVTVEGLTEDNVWENCLDFGSTVTLDFVYRTYGANCTKYSIPLNGGSYKGIKITGNETFYGGPNENACTFSEIQVYASASVVLPGLGYYNEHDPIQSFGENGNIYVNLITGIIYQKQNGVWVQL